MPWSGPAKRRRDAPKTGSKHKHSLPCLSGQSVSEGWCSHVPNKGESFDLEALDRQMVRYYGSLLSKKNLKALFGRYKCLS